MSSETAAVKACTCKHEYQDKTYGPGQRVCNQTASKGDKKVYRCTVCGALK